MLEYQKEYHISRLFAAYLSGTITPEEEVELKEWHEQSSHNRELFELICSSSNLEERNQFQQELDICQTWEGIQQRLQASRRKKMNRRILSGVAAALLFLVGFAAFFFRGAPPEQSEQALQIVAGSAKAEWITAEGNIISLINDESLQTLALDNHVIFVNDGKRVVFQQADTLALLQVSNNRVRVPRGGEYELLLSDNTKVWLNSESELSFPTLFTGSQREVVLKGEAYFEVSPDQTRPFVVHTPHNVQINVLGTSFNVEAYPDDRQVQTTLCSGSVRVSEGELSIVLEPNQQAIYSVDEGSLISRKVDARNYVSWKEGLFVFDEESLESLMRKLSRWYDVEVVFESEELKRYHFTGDLRRYDDFTRALKYLEKSTNKKIYFIVEGKKITVKNISL